MLNEVRIGQISKESWRLLEGLYHVTETLWKSTFIVSRRETARSINQMMSQSLSLEPIICQAIDREGFKILDVSETQKSFKNYTNLPDELHLAVGSRVIFLDNSLIHRGISNGTIGVVTEIKEIEMSAFRSLLFQRRMA